jgi:hypothetical protein
MAPKFPMLLCVSKQLSVKPWVELLQPLLQEANHMIHIIPWVPFWRIQTFIPAAKERGNGLKYCQHTPQCSRDRVSTALIEAADFRYVSNSPPSVINHQFAFFHTSYLLHTVCHYYEVQLLSTASDIACFGLYSFMLPSHWIRNSYMLPSRWFSRRGWCPMLRHATFPVLPDCGRHLSLERPLLQYDW